MCLAGTGKDQIQIIAPFIRFKNSDFMDHTTVAALPFTWQP